MAGQAEHQVIHLDWSDDPLRCRRLEDLPSTDPESVAAATAAAEQRVLRALDPFVAADWGLDGDIEHAVSLVKRERMVLLPTPGFAGPMWTEYVGADVHLRRR
jgi:hypothetical protein